MFLRLGISVTAIEPKTATQEMAQASASQAENDGVKS